MVERRTSATSSNSWCLGSRQVHNSKASDDGEAALLDVCRRVTSSKCLALILFFLKNALED
ncbi:hypothetical protein K0M31_001088 [Melipona bicolor]|uniref:Uncharacterized protein n=1 Tax=Melipona bicolor TaxID=60889 RepID=A0AA40GF59_9HYME|nr:hypothetical protein K0M31_001088 [Melipona bicolor]